STEVGGHLTRRNDLTAPTLPHHIGHNCLLCRVCECRRDASKRKRHHREWNRCRERKQYKRDRAQAEPECQEGFATKLVVPPPRRDDKDRIACRICREHPT